MSWGTSERELQGNGPAAEARPGLGSSMCRREAASGLRALLGSQVLESFALAGVLALARILGRLAVRLPLAGIGTVTGHELVPLGERRSGWSGGGESQQRRGRSNAESRLGV